MDIKDTGKDELIDNATANIELKRKYLMENYTWMTRENRLAKKEQIKMMEDNREKLVEERIGKTIKRMPSLYVPGPQSELEKQLLLDLIESV